LSHYFRIAGGIKPKVRNLKPQITQPIGEKQTAFANYISLHSCGGQCQTP
jgi:hypothetical protein